MKIRTWTVGLAVLLSGARVHADLAKTTWDYDTNVKSVACDSCCGDDCCGDECCGDPCCGDPCCGDGVGCGDCCGGGLVGAFEGFTLASLIGLADDSQWVIGGWNQTGYHDNNDGVFNTHPDNVNVHQQWFYLGRNVDGSNGIDVGGRVDVVYGVDGSNTQSFGNNPGQFDFQNGWDHGIYGWAMPQCYGEVAMGDLSVKVGHFWTLLGYQVVPATGNFFYSIPYTFNFSEAFTHTGVLTTYKMSDTVSVYNGWTLGWDTGFDQVGSGNSYLGGWNFTGIDNLNVTYICTAGNLGWIGNNAYTHSVVGILDITDKFQYVFQSDMVDVENSINSGGGRYDTFGINQYMFYTINDLLKGGVRMEWWKADGVSLYEMAWGLNVTPLANVRIRPEYRYNWCPTNNLPSVIPITSSTTGNNTTAGDYIDQGIAACDVIWTF